MSYDVLSIINLVITIMLSMGGIMAYRHGLARTASEVQERVINALKSEIETLTHKIEQVEKENHRLNQIIATICAALKKRGLAVTIDGDLVSISDSAGTHSMRIQEEGNDHGDTRR